MGGSSSSSSTSKTINQSWDYSTHITQTDHGAVEAGKQVSMQALAAMGKSQQAAFEFASDNVDKSTRVTLAAMDLAKNVNEVPLAALGFMERTSTNALEVVANATNPQSSQDTLIKWGAMTAIALGIAQVIRK